MSRGREGEIIIDEIISMKVTIKVISAVMVNHDALMIFITIYN